MQGSVSIIMRLYMGVLRRKAGNWKIISVKKTAGRRFLNAGQRGRKFQTWMRREGTAEQKQWRKRGKSRMMQKPFLKERIGSRQIRMLERPVCYIAFYR